MLPPNVSINAIVLGRRGKSIETHLETYDSIGSTRYVRF